MTTVDNCSLCALPASEWLVVDDPLRRRTVIRQERLVSMDRPHLACLRTTITPRNWSGVLQVRSLLDGRVRNDNVAEFAALAKDHLTEPVTGHHSDGTCWLVTETTQSQVRIAVAARTTTSRDDARRRDIHIPGRAGNEWTVPVETGVPVTVDKTVAVFTSRDSAISEPLDAARDELAHAPAVSALRAAHTLAWEHLWQRLHLSVLRSGTDLRLWLPESSAGHPRLRESACADDTATRR